ncbi:MAG: Flp1 family type IVb pilin [bacterium]|nr:Flp1 family type IVb pilin [bacterium]
MNQVRKGLNMVKESVKGFVNEEDGVGIVEIILILVVLVGLVVIFKDRISGVVNGALGDVEKDASDLYD